MTCLPPPPPPQHLTALLASPDPDVVTAVLAALAAYLRKPHHSLLRWQAPGPLTVRLLIMARGWGGKEEVGVRGLDAAVVSAKFVWATTTTAAAAAPVAAAVAQPTQPTDQPINRRTH
jgi:hypothetical protein